MSISEEPWKLRTISIEDDLANDTITRQNNKTLKLGFVIACVFH